MSERLEREGVIDDRPIFMTSILYFKYLRGKGNVKAGEYEFRKNATMREVLDTLVEGRSIEHKVTLAEGLTTQQMVEKIRANPDLHGDITQIPPEGSLLPDTYKFGRDDTRQEIIERMQAAQAKFLAKVWDERDPDIVVQTPEEALILASIVEKETGRADERPHIASVFQNRLAQEHAPAVGSDHHLRAGGRQGRARSLRSSRTSSTATRNIILTRSMACRRRRSPVPDGQRSRRC